MGKHRRNGSAVFEFIHELGWKPERLVLAGVGVDPMEAISFHEDWPDAEIIGFEPNPVTCRGLSSNFPGILFNEAISDKPGRQTLHFRHTWKNGSSLHELDANGRNLKIEVPVTTLSRLSHVPETVLWLDVEGEELRALQGAGRFLDTVQMVNVEMTGKPRGENWASPMDIHRYLLTLGFLQIYIHTIRTCRYQFDAIYVRRELFKPELCTCMDSIRIYEEMEGN